MSPVDRRYGDTNYLRPISLSVSDKDMDNPKSRRYPENPKEKSILHRPVSDQRLHEPIKKEVSWHSKIPTSVQTLSCVEDTTVPEEISKLQQEEKHTQSQPILGTLESNSRNKHVCRHTYSVRQSYSSAKENSKGWNLKRSSSEEKTKLKDKYIPLSLNTINVTSSTTTTTDSNCSSTSSALCDSKLDVLDTSREDAFSLIDWEEDEKACDAEVQNIIGQTDEDEDEDEKPTPSLPLQTSLDSEVNTPLLEIKDTNLTDSSNEKPNSLESLPKANVEIQIEIGDAGHSKDSEVSCEKENNVVNENNVVIHETYADNGKSSESTCDEKHDEKQAKTNNDTRLNIPLDHLSVPSPCGKNDGSLLAVPSAARDSSPYQHERRKEESHL